MKGFFTNNSKLRNTAFVILLFLAWQVTFVSSRPSKPEVTPYHSCSLGLCGFYEIYREASAFFYYSGVFPIVSLNSLEESLGKIEILEYLSGEGALLNDKKYATRMGEVGKVFLFFPSMFWGDQNSLPTIRPVLISAFLLGGSLFLVAMSLNGMLLLGFFILLLLGSSPNLIYENYENLNLFGFSVSILLISMSLGMIVSHLITKTNPRILYKNPWVILFFAMMALVSVFAKEIRSEVFYCSMSGILALFLGNPLKKRTYIFGFVFLFLLWAGGKFFESYWNAKFQQAREFVLERGKGYPIPLEVPRPRSHEVWHNILTGFGDFDQKYGYRWDDRIVYKWTLDRLNALTNRNFKSVDYYINDEFWDQDKMYPVRSCDFPEYQQVTKEVLVRQITEDPVWYYEILKKRITTIQTQIGSFYLTFGKYSQKILNPRAGIVFSVAITLLYFLVNAFKPRIIKHKLKSKRTLIILAVCPLIIAAPSIIVTTAHGASFINYYQYFWFGIGVFIFTILIKQIFAQAYKHKSRL